MSMIDFDAAWVIFLGAFIASMIIMSMRRSGGGKPPTSGMPPPMTTPDFCRDLDALEEAFEPRSRPGPRPGFPLP